MGYIQGSGIRGPDWRSLAEPFDWYCEPKTQTWKASCLEFGYGGLLFLATWLSRESPSTHEMLRLEVTM